MTALHPGPAAAQSVTGAVERLGALIDAALAWASAHATVLAVLGVGIAAITDVLRWWVRRRRHARMLRGAVTVAVVAPPRVDPDGAVVFWSNLLGLLAARSCPGCAGAAASGVRVRLHPGWGDGERVGARRDRGRAGRPRGHRGLARQPHHPHPHTHAPRTTHGDGGEARRPRDRRTEVVAGGQLRLARGAALPLDTGTSGVDPIRALLAAPGPLRAGEWVRVQVLARPVSSARLARLARTATGRRRTRIVGAATTRAAGGDPRAAGRDRPPARPRARTSRPVTGYGCWPPRARMLEIAQDRAAVGKARGGGFETLIRYATATPRPHSAAAVADGSPSRPEHTASLPVTISHDAAPNRARPPRGGAETPELVDAEDRARFVVEGRAHAVASAFAAFSGHNHYRRHRLHHPATAITTRRLRRGDVLSVPELAALAHLPVDEHVPGLLRAGAAAVAPPPHTPAPGPGVKPLGDSDATPARPVGLTVADGRHHLQIIGATGSGKSTLMTHLVLRRRRRRTRAAGHRPQRRPHRRHHHPPPRPRPTADDPDRPRPPAPRRASRRRDRCGGRCGRV